MPRHSPAAEPPVADAFQIRLLRSERWRALLLGVVWLTAIVSVELRRAVGGMIVSVDAVFYSMLGLLAFAVGFEALVFLDAHRRLRRGIPPSSRAWILTATLDLAIPIASLWILQVLTQDSRPSSVAAPALLAVPLVILLSVLRLQPWIALASGVAAGVMHWALVLFTIRTAGIERHAWPVLFTYGELLVLTGVVAAVVAGQVRSHVREAVDEAVSAEKAERELAAVDHDLSVARQIQQGLMPQSTPAFAGYDIAGMARPAQQTGGDYYDWQPLPDGRLVVAVADVTGHGIGPALVMAVCRAYSRASAPGAPDPSALLTRINALICDDVSSTGRFITMVIVMLSRDGSIEMVSAGHGPTLLQRSGGEIETFGGDGPPLGIDPTMSYGPTRKLKLAPGDALLLLTDGFVEWARAGDGQLFGSDRLCATLAEAGGAGARAVLETLDAAVQAFAGGAPQRDDTTAVAICRQP